MYLPIFVVLCIMRLSFGQDSSDSCEEEGYNPVCITSGITIKNECYFNKMKSESSDFEIIKYGPCWTEIESLALSDEFDASEIMSAIIPEEEIPVVAEILASNEELESLISTLFARWVMLIANDGNALTLNSKAFFKIFDLVMEDDDAFNAFSSVYHDVLKIIDSNEDVRNTVDLAVAAGLDLLKNDPEASPGLDFFVNLLVSVQ